MIRTLLVANRGEIARRIFRTARSLGIRTVAVHSGADVDLPHVREADRAVCIGPPAPSASYLDIGAILTAARTTGADAIHPGYGFLAERAVFARAVIDAGLTWVGPDPASIDAMGDKARARHLAARLGVPVVPGYDGVDQSDSTFADEAARIGFPVLIKASAGGGGRGMRRVDEPAGLADALASARREAEGAFGDGTLLLERYVERPRHIEVQVFGDRHGNVVHLHERECSIQRRHQKIVEEAPSPAVDAGLRARLGAAAVQLARAVDYVGAGTVEFVLGPDGRFYFLEMNTRLQVEHEVTELITGVDLVAWQLLVAEGGRIPLAQDEIPLVGHAIEVRVVAEDPDHDWRPTHGRLHRVDLHGTRVSAGYTHGDVVGVHYDSMLAKVLAHGPDRARATRSLARSLESAWIPGIVTNLPLLRQIVAHPLWVSGELDTAFLARAGLPLPPPIDAELGPLGGTALLAWQTACAAPVAVRPGWRLHGAEWQVDRWRSGAQVIEVRHRFLADGLEVELAGVSHRLVLHGREQDVLSVTLDGVRQSWRVVHVPCASGRTTLDDGDAVYVHSGLVEAFVMLEPRFPAPAPPAVDPGSCAAPTPGTVRVVDVRAGDTVRAGQLLVVLEAMKMEHPVRSPSDGVVREVRVVVGDAVAEGALLVVLDPAMPDPG
jgi:acetyl/propionyl-CoA carboxylase alpha subunit